MTRRLVVVSDLHLAPAGPLCSFFAGEKLASFFEAQARADTTVVMAGDIFDFLQVEPRPPELDMKGAPALLGLMLNALAKEDWGQRVLAAWKALLDKGGRLVLMPGNHDPEMFHPEVPWVLAQKLAHPDVLWEEAQKLGRADTNGIVHHTEYSPWLGVIGGLPVWVVHGNRVDAWNDIDPARVKEAIVDGETRKLPPGSRLVLDVMNPLKKLVDENGRRTLAFVDLLKPEIENVLLLVPYLAWDEASSYAPAAGKLLASAKLLGRLERLVSKKVLASGPEIPEARSEEERLADALASMLEPGEQNWASLQRKVGTMISPPPPVAAGTLASHTGALQWAARRYLKLKLARDGSFFEPEHLSGEDKAIIKAHLAEGTGPRVVVAGHTHAARWKDFGDGRVYLNSGTWMDLMRVPDLSSQQKTEGWLEALLKSQEVKDWIDKLEAGQAERLQRPTYVEITSEGARLLEWKGTGGEIVR